ncbi:MAG: hypothetical protein QM756_34815 [Polyangiaceae bacterium]
MDPYTVGYLLGPTFLVGGIGYFVGRKLVGASGVSEVERLKHLAGVAEPGAKPPSRLRGLVPYALAVLGAIVGLLFSAASLINERTALKSNSAELEQAFVARCTSTCVRLEGAERQACESHCACLLAEVKRQHDSAESLQAFLQGALSGDPATRSDFRRAEAGCPQ